MTTYVESDIIAETKKLVNQSIIYHIIIYMYYHICVYQCRHLTTRSYQKST